MRHPFIRFKGQRALVGLGIALISLVYAQSDVQVYLNEALDILETNAEHRDSVDWPALRQDAMNSVAHVETIADTYPVIRSILTEDLRDANGYLLEPPATAGAPGPLSAQIGFRVLVPDWAVVYVWPGSPADEAGMRVGDRLVSVNGVPVADSDVSAVPKVPGGAGAVHAECEEGAADYCEVLRAVYTPGTDLELSRMGELGTQHYALEPSTYSPQLFPVGCQFGAIGYIEVPPAGSTATKEATRAIIEQYKESCGWIVDIRRHAGGGYPSFNTIYPLWDEENKTGLAQALPPTAYLLSPLTYSGGEGVAYILAEQDNFRSFGEPTGGDHPKMRQFTLSDGAVLAVTWWNMRRTPDVEVMNDWTRFQTEEDPVIQAALSWLNDQPSCHAEE